MRSFSVEYASCGRRKVFDACATATAGGVADGLCARGASVEASVAVTSAVTLATAYVSGAMAELPICVLGIRSGSSLATRALVALGADPGTESELLPAVEGDNAKGYWEQQQL